MGAVAAGGRDGRRGALPRAPAAFLLWFLRAESLTENAY